ncbi:MAG: Clp protease N-terminal domain-containing protein [Gemmataceae bacterium]
MFKRFTPRARRAAELAQEEAQQWNHQYLGTEHLFIGLLREGNGVAANILRNLDVDLNAALTEIEQLVQPGPDLISKGRPFTPPAKRVLEFAFEEANNLGHRYLGTEHLLLGLIREQQGIAAEVLTSRGLLLEDLREEIMNLEAGGTGPLPPETPISRCWWRVSSGRRYLPKNGLKHSHLWTTRNGKSLLRGNKSSTR